MPWTVCQVHTKYRDEPPGTAVKYGNGEIETIESIVDIGQIEVVQVTPNNCSASLISVNEIVQDNLAKKRKGKNNRILQTGSHQTLKIDEE